VIGAVGRDKAGVVEPLTALTALGVGQTMFGLRVATTRSSVDNLQGSSKLASFFCTVSQALANEPCHLNAQRL